MQTARSQAPRCRPAPAAQSCGPARRPWPPAAEEWRCLAHSVSRPPHVGQDTCMGSLAPLPPCTATRELASPPTRTSDVHSRATRSFCLRPTSRLSRKAARKARAQISGTQVSWGRSRKKGCLAGLAAASSLAPAAAAVPASPAAATASASTWAATRSAPQHRRAAASAQAPRWLMNGDGPGRCVLAVHASPMQPRPQVRP